MSTDRLTTQELWRPESGFIPSEQFSDASVRQIAEKKGIIGESLGQTETIPEPPSLLPPCPLLMVQRSFLTTKGTDDL